MTLEARLAFLLAFFALWSLLGLVSWTLTAVLTRGRGALLALPLALAAAAAGGVLPPALGLRDERGFLLSLLTALSGGALGTIAAVTLTWIAFRPTAAHSPNDEEMGKGQ